MQCPRCQQDNPVGDAQFCPRCGAPAAIPAASYADLQRELIEAREQQTATSEILRVMSRSQTDVQPVFDAIVQSGLRLCDGYLCVLTRFDGSRLHLVALNAHPDFTSEGVAAFRRPFPVTTDEAGLLGRAIVERIAYNTPDVVNDPRAGPYGSSMARALGYRALVHMPMLHEETAVGAISVGKRQAEPFSDKQIALLRTFADQAVIAIENVRLFNETKEALEQQTATSEILGVISRSPTDVQPVFETIVQSAAQLCEATFAVLHRFDGRVITFDAHHGMTEQEVAGSRDRFPLPTDRGTAVGRAILDRRTTHIHDIRRDAAYRVSAWQTSFQTVLAVPLLREGVPVGAIGLWRREVQPFSEKQIRLVETFADQAVIAIENVRLFNELQASNRDLTTALDKQTATSDILRVISQSQTNVQPVFDTIVRNAVRLCGALYGAVTRTEGDLIHLAAQYNLPPDQADALRHAYPIPVSSNAPVPRSMRAGTVYRARPMWRLNRNGSREPRRCGPPCDRGALGVIWQFRCCAGALR
jgi:two-component system, NtrC family, sensor kinase